MDTHSRLRQLLEERGWTEYRLAKKCGLSQSTLANIFKRNTIYRKYRDVMYQAAFQVLNDRVTAEDAVHDAFLSILDHIHKIDLFGQGRSYGLAVVLARNKAVDIIRRSKPSVSLEGMEGMEEGALVVDADLETEIPCNLLDTLPDCYSSVLKLRVFGFTPTEIAELQDINILTVYKRIARGKKMILEKIRKERL